MPPTKKERALSTEERETLSVRDEEPIDESTMQGEGTNTMQIQSVTLAAASPSPRRRRRPTASDAASAAAVSFAHALPMGVTAGIITVSASGCPSFLSGWPAWARSLLMLTILLIVVLLGVCAGIIVVCKPRRCAKCCPWSRRRCLQGAIVPVLLTAILLAVPATGTPYMLAVGQRSLTGLGADWVPPSGYCAQAAAQTEWFAGFAGLQPGEPAYEERFGWLMGNLTQAEKLRLIQGVGWDWPYPPKDFYSGSVPGVPRLGIPSLHMSDAGQGWRTTDRRHVGRVTSFPSGLAAAATWDVGAVREYAAAIGEEFRTKGANAVLGPSLDLVRTPYGGRSAESLAGEEPYLGAALVAAYVSGVRSVGVAAVVKHFSLNNQETGRMGAISSNAGRRALEEAHYPPVRAAVDAEASSVSALRLPSLHADSPASLHADDPPHCMQGEQRQCAARPAGHIAGTARLLVPTALALSSPAPEPRMTCPCPCPQCARTTLSTARRRVALTGCCAAIWWAGWPSTVTW